MATVALYAFESPALIYAWTGEFDEAFRLLDHLLTAPSVSLSFSLLKLDPMFDPLRNDPRFKALTESSSAPTSH